MSFSSVLKSIGKDLSHVGTWINDGLKIAEPVIGVVDPALGTILTKVEGIISAVPAGTTLTESTVQQLVTAVSALESIAAASLPVKSTTTTTSTTTAAAVQ
jgi:hypothetical protein